MNRRALIRIITLSAIGTVPLLASGKRDTLPPPRKPGGKVLKVGASRRFDGGNLSVTFLAVLKDRRCPINAGCLTAGDAAVLLRIKVRGGKYRLATLHTDHKPTRVIASMEYPEGSAGIPKSYAIAIRSLTPLPFAGKKTRQRDFRLTLDVDTAT